MTHTVHVSPMNDVIEHDLQTDDCVCVPRQEAVPHDDGTISWIVIHSSLDGREGRTLLVSEQEKR